MDEVLSVLPGLFAVAEQTAAEVRAMASIEQAEELIGRRAAAVTKP